MLKLEFSTFPVLETPRLILRAHANTDSETLFAMRNNDDVMRFIHRERQKTIAEIEDFITEFNLGCQQGKHLAWVIAWKENPDQMIGSIGYWRTDLANYRAEIGYMLHPTYWRKGIVSEALTKTIEFGFTAMKLHSIHANVSPDNEASRQILIKHGFMKEAYLKEDHYFNGKFLDSEIYGRLNPHD
jgi:ribosomal-protein-alanine N-acetyltransferase